MHRTTNAAASTARACGLLAWLSELFVIRAATSELNRKDPKSSITMKNSNLSPTLRLSGSKSANGEDSSRHAYETNPIFQIHAMKTKLTSIVLALQLASPLAATALTLGEALNATNLVWETGGYTPWLPETTKTYDGDSAASVSSDPAESWLETVVSGSGTMTFAWSVSTEYENGYLSFYIDGARMNRISGNTAWQTQTFTISGSGFHTLRWEYDKNASYWGGASVAWLDQVAFSSSKAQQFITFAPANCLAGSPPFALSAIASSGLPVTFTQISGPPFLAGNVLTPSTAGTLTISASQAGNASYAPAPPVTTKVVVVGSNLVDVLPLRMFPNFTLVAYGNGRFLAVGSPHWSSGVGLCAPLSVFSSPDGLNWTALEPTPDPNSSVCDMVTSPRRLLFTGSEFVVVGPNGWGDWSSICRSVDGQTWSCKIVTDGTVSVPCGWVSTTRAYTTLYEAAYGNGVLLTAAHVSTSCGYCGGDFVGLLRYTIPALVFSSLQCPPSCCDYTKVGGLGFGEGNFLYIYGGNCYRSVDGTAPIDYGPFPKLKTTDTSYPVRFAYGAGKFVAVGMLTNAPRGTILISSNGTAWGATSPSFLTAGPLTDVAFLGGKFITLGDSDLLKSDDGGQTWGAFAGGTGGRGVSFNRDVYVVTRPDGTVQACYQPTLPVITSPTNATGIKDVPFSYQITASASPTGFGAEGLPLGLTANPTNGLISGVPASTGNFPVTLLATNTAGTASAILQLTLLAPVPATIVTNPASQTVPAFETATFSVEAVGTAPLSYQWRFNETNDVGGNNSVLSLLSVATNQAGNYRVVVTNAFGAATSSVAILSVSAPLPKFVAGSAGMSNGQFGFIFQSEAGRSVQIEASTNLQVWTNITVLTNVTGRVQFADSVTNLPQRFYRARLLP